MKCRLKPALQFFASDERLRRLRIKPFFAFKVVPVTFRSEKQLLMQLFSAYRPSILLPNAVRVDEKGSRRRTSRSWSASYAPFPPAHRARSEERRVGKEGRCKRWLEN